MSNRPKPTPNAYPVVFHSIIRAGGGVVYSNDLPWSPISSAKRFRQLLALLRASPGHPLQAQAKKRWRVQPLALALTCTVCNFYKGDTPSLTGALIDAAIGENPNDPARPRVIR